jgi:hypothetical protein
MLRTEGAPAAPDEIVSLARRWLGEGGSVYYAPSIPPAKADHARRIHAQHLPESEALLVLYDGTVFGSAENGFVVTAARLCWKNLFEHPRQIEWSALDPAGVEPGDGSVLVAGGSIGTLSDVVPAAAAAFLHEMAARAGGGNAGPYRVGADRPHADDEGARVTLSRLVSLSRSYLGEVSDIFYHPAIPPAKLQKVRTTHRRHLPAAEEIAALYDATVFGSAENGFALTTRRLCWKNLADEPGSREWHEIDPDIVAPSGNLVHIGGAEIQLDERGDRVVRAAALIAAVAREARPGPAR